MASFADESWQLLAIAPTAILVVATTLHVHVGESFAGVRAHSPVR